MSGLQKSASILVEYFLRASSEPAQAKWQAGGTLSERGTVLGCEFGMFIASKFLYELLRRNGF